MSMNQIKKNIEIQIRNNFFKNKEELYKYILQFKKYQSNYFLTEKETEELLKLYDKLNQKSDIPLDMNNYSNKNVNDKNFIVSESDDRILTTNGNTTDFIKEFKDTQNQIYAYTQDGKVNSNEVFKKIADTKKEELTMMTINEAIASPHIEQELLSKIKFFITRESVDPYAYKIDLKTGMFYNGETNQMYEVRKNTNTNKYEIYVSGEIKYDNTTNVENESETLRNDHDEEQVMEESRNKPKVRKLTPQRNLNNAAFTKIGFLIINIISFTLASITIGLILLNK